MVDLAADVPPLTVLLVEDSAEIAAMYRLGLELGGWNVVLATSGEAALQEAPRCHPSVIVLDVSMPGMDGFAVLERLRADLRTAEIPVVMFSNHGDRQMIERGLTLGARDYLVKSQFTPRMLSKALSSRMRLPDQRPAGGKALREI